MKNIENFTDKELDELISRLNAEKKKRRNKNDFDSLQVEKRLRYFMYDLDPYAIVTGEKTVDHFKWHILHNLTSSIKTIADLTLGNFTIKDKHYDRVYAGVSHPCSKTSVYRSPSISNGLYEDYSSLTTDILNLIKDYYKEEVHEKILKEVS